MTPVRKIIEYPCPRCRAQREHLEAGCWNCGWFPDPIKAAAKPGSSSIRVLSRQSLWSDLDWSSPTERIPPWRTHKRVYWSILLGIVISFVTWHTAFPNTQVSAKLWAAFGSGGLAGIIVGSCWQLANVKRRMASYGSSLLGFMTIFAVSSVITFTLVAPSLAEQERELDRFRSLREADIVEVRLSAGKFQCELSDHNAVIRRFTLLARSASMYYPHNEGSLETLDISIRLRNGKVLNYKGRIPENHPDDLSIDIGTSSGPCEIRLHDVRHWINVFRRVEPL